MSDSSINDISRSNRNVLRQVFVNRHATLRAALVGTTALMSVALSAPARAQAPQQRPNIVMIMADDVGIWNISAYHRGMMGGSTPNIDRIAKEGALFTDYYAQQSCTAGRAAFILGQTPFRTRRSRSKRRSVTSAANASIGTIDRRYFQNGQMMSKNC